MASTHGSEGYTNRGFARAVCAAAIVGFTLLGLLLPAAPASAAAADGTADKYATAAELGLMKGFPPPPDKRVNKSNALLTGPFNRWSYLHMRMFFPSAAIPAAEHPSTVEKALDKGVEGVKIEHPGTGTMVDLDTFLKETYTDALVVVRGDKVVYEKYLNGMAPDQPHQMMSVTKSFCGLLGLMAVADGKISEDDQVTKYVPELKQASAFDGATFGQVLNMTNSMDFTEDYADPRSGIRQYGAVIGWTAKEPDIQYANSLYDYLVTLQIDKNYKHGQIFHYQTPKTDVVNWVTNRVNNESFQGAMYHQIWSKIGAEGETYILLDGNATLVAGGGLNATPYNLARFAMMMLDDGKSGGQQVVPAEVIHKIAEGGSIKAFDNGPDSDDIVHRKGEWSYRAQWWVKHTKGMEAYMAIGIHGQWIYIDPTHDVAIIKQSSQPKSKDTVLNGFDLEGFYAIVKYLSAD